MQIRQLSINAAFYILQKRSSSYDMSKMYVSKITHNILCWYTYILRRRRSWGCQRVFERDTCQTRTTHWGNIRVTPLLFLCSITQQEWPIIRVSSYILRGVSIRTRRHIKITRGHPPSNNVFIMCWHRSTLSRRSWVRTLIVVSLQAM